MVFPNAMQDPDSLPQNRHSGAGGAVVSQLAKIRMASGREELCLLQDVTAEGLKAIVYVRFETGAHVDIELRTAHSAGGRIVWSVDGVIGVAFDEPIPMAAMLAHCAFGEGADTLRPPRLKVKMRGLLRIDSQIQMVDIGNISLAGLQIAAPQPLRPGTICQITIAGSRARAATICWWRDGNAGLMLAEPFDYAAFAALRAASPT